MDLNNPKPFHIQAIPKFVLNEEGHARSAFKWGLISNPQMLNTDIEGTLSFIFNLEEQKEIGPEMVSMMRLFACNIVKDLISGESIVDQRSGDVKIGFMNERPDIKKFLVDSIDALEVEVLRELAYQIDRQSSDNVYLGLKIPIEAFPDVTNSFNSLLEYEIGTSSRLE